MPLKDYFGEVFIWLRLSMVMFGVPVMEATMASGPHEKQNIKVLVLGERNGTRYYLEWGLWFLWNMNGDNNPSLRPLFYGRVSSLGPGLPGFVLNVQGLDLGLLRIIINVMATTSLAKTPRSQA